MSELLVEPTAAVMPQVLDQVRAFVAGLNTLHDLVLRSLALDPPRLIADVLVQDEFTNDVVLPWDAPYWLVFDTS